MRVPSSETGEAPVRGGPQGRVRQQQRVARGTAVDGTRADSSSKRRGDRRRSGSGGDGGGQASGKRPAVRRPSAGSTGTVRRHRSKGAIGGTSGSRGKGDGTGSGKDSGGMHVEGKAVPGQGLQPVQRIVRRVPREAAPVVTRPGGLRTSMVTDRRGSSGASVSSSVLSSSSGGTGSDRMVQGSQLRRQLLLQAYNGVEGAMELVQDWESLEAAVKDRKLAVVVVDGEALGTSFDTFVRRVAACLRELSTTIAVGYVSHASLDQTFRGAPEHLRRTVIGHSAGGRAVCVARVAGSIDLVRVISPTCDVEEAVTDALALVGASRCVADEASASSRDGRVGPDERRAEGLYRDLLEHAFSGPGGGGSEARSPSGESGTSRGRVAYVADEGHGDETTAQEARDMDQDVYSSVRALQGHLSALDADDASVFESLVKRALLGSLSGDTTAEGPPDGPVVHNRLREALPETFLDILRDVMDGNAWNDRSALRKGLTHLVAMGMFAAEDVEDLVANVLRPDMVAAGSRDTTSPADMRDTPVGMEEYVAVGVTRGATGDQDVTTNMEGRDSDAHDIAPAEGSVDAAPLEPTPRGAPSVHEHIPSSGIAGDRHRQDLTLQEVARESRLQLEGEKKLAEDRELLVAETRAYLDALPADATKAQLVVMCPGGAKISIKELERTCKVRFVFGVLALHHGIYEPDAVLRMRSAEVCLAERASGEQTLDDLKWTRTRLHLEW